MHCIFPYWIWSTFFSQLSALKQIYEFILHSPRYWLPFLVLSSVDKINLALIWATENTRARPSTDTSGYQLQCNSRKAAHRFEDQIHIQTHGTGVLHPYIPLPSTHLPHLAAPSSPPISPRSSSVQHLTRPPPSTSSISRQDASMEGVRGAE